MNISTPTTRDPAFSCRRKMVHLISQYPGKLFPFPPLGIIKRVFKAKSQAWEMEAEMSRDQGQPQLYSEFEASVSFVGPWLKNRKDIYVVCISASLTLKQEWYYSLCKFAAKIKFEKKKKKRCHTQKRASIAVGIITTIYFFLISNPGNYFQINVA